MFKYTLKMLQSGRANLTFALLGTFLALLALWKGSVWEWLTILRVWPTDRCTTPACCWIQMHEEFCALDMSNHAVISCPDNVMAVPCSRFRVAAICLKLSLIVEWLPGINMTLVIAAYDAAVAYTVTGLTAFPSCLLRRTSSCDLLDHTSAFHHNHPRLQAFLACWLHLVDCAAWQVATIATVPWIPILLGHLLSDLHAGPATATAVSCNIPPAAFVGGLHRQP